MNTTLKSRKISTRVKMWLFFLVFGTVTGVLLGEAGNPIMLIPYGIIMAVYTYGYTKFSWWKVALASYLSGILAENIGNRAPIQIPTLMWVAFTVYPFFITKSLENIRRINFRRVLKDAKWVFIIALLIEGILLALTWRNLSPPLLILAPAIPFVLYIPISLIKLKGRENKPLIRNNEEDDKFKDLIPIFVVLAAFAALIIVFSSILENARRVEEPLPQEEIIFEDHPPVILQQIIHKV